MVAAATTLRDSIESAWALGGRLSKVPVAGVEEVVRFFDRAQVVGNQWTKAVTVEKINAEGKEQVVNHPNFNEISDTYEIVVSFRVPGTEPTSFTDAIDNIELMGTEVLRILLTIYDPSQLPPVNTYFKVVKTWSNEDIYKGNQPELKRRLRFVLTKITSSSEEVFIGFGSILLLDTSATVADDKPVADYSYTEVQEVKTSEGYDSVPILTKDKTFGVGVPLQVRGIFSGTFTAFIYAKKSDIDGATIDKLDNIGNVQSNTPIKSQLARITFLDQSKNTETPIKTFQKDCFVNITRVEKVQSEIDLLTYRIFGIMIRPSVVTILG